MPESIGTFDKLWVSVDEVVYYAIEFLDGSSLNCTDTLVNPKGMRGTRQERAERTRWTQTIVNGQLNFAPNSAEVDLLIPWVVGNVKVGNAFALNEVGTALTLKVSRDGAMATYAKCMVQNFTMSCQEGSPLQFGVSLVGRTETLGGTAPAAVINDATGPFVMRDGTLTIGGVAYAFRGLEVSIDNALEAKFNNSIGPTSVHATDMAVTCSTTLSFGDASAIYGSGLIDPHQVVVTFTNREDTDGLPTLTAAGIKTFQVTMPDVRAPREGLMLGGRRARDLVWRGVARRTAASPVIAITNAVS